MAVNLISCNSLDLSPEKAETSLDLEKCSWAKLKNTTRAVKTLTASPRTRA